MYNKASIYKGGGVYNLGDGASSKLPANTLRFLFSKSDYDPTVAGVGSSGTWQKVDTAAANVWDWTRSGTSFFESFINAFTDSNNLVSVIKVGDTSTITSMGSLFNGCTSLTSVPLFDTSAVTSVQRMFNGCTSLTRVPLFDTSKVSNMNSMLSGCTKVEGGALALYQQASTQTTPPLNHTSTFNNCGIDTPEGRAALAQIPASWGGTGPEPTP